MVSNMKHTVEVMIPEAEIKARIAELGRQITEHYKDSGSEMVLVGLLRGSFMFMADLCREVQVSHEVDFMTASSYGSGMSTTRDVKILKDLDEDIRGKCWEGCASGRVVRPPSPLPQGEGENPRFIYGSHA